MARTTKRVVSRDDQNTSITVETETPTPPAVRIAKSAHASTHPDTGLTAVWLEGEVIPDWAALSESESNTLES